MRSQVGLSFGQVAVGLVFAVVMAAGCADDLYSSCAPEDESGCEDAESCISRPDFECSSRICGRYQGSDFYCTVECQSDGDCTDGECREFVLQSGNRYCVPSDEL